MASGTKRQAQQHVSDIRGRMDAFFRGDIGEDEFRAQQRAQWDRIQAAPHDVEAEVLRIIRLSLPAVGRAA